MSSTTRSAAPDGTEIPRNNRVSCACPDSRSGAGGQHRDFVKRPNPQEEPYAAESPLANSGESSSMR